MLSTEADETNGRRRWRRRRWPSRRVFWLFLYLQQMGMMEEWIM
jgi:hypothetical protein